ncbi:MAG TPA: carboxymuconolactone decarboxylase family protein [Acidimicrobiales bacterium]|nr:carboxymuconolactone decarboxylase family protein [Acidimicrobiales bacterium]
MSAETEHSRPRLAPLEQAEWDDFLARLVDASGGPDRALNIFTTLGRHPELFRPWISFGGALLAGQLPGRVRELAILRTAVRSQADYEWAHHAPMAAELGVTEEELSAIRRPLADHPWSDEEGDVLRAVDEMHDTWTLSDGSWAAVHGRLGDAGSIELVMLVGQYHLVALLLRTLHVEIETQPDG